MAGSNLLMVNQQGGGGGIDEHVQALTGYLSKIQPENESVHLSIRVRPGFKAQQGRCKRKRTDKESQSSERKIIRLDDFFSRLPDDIIILVLSRLETIQQQVATSVLARRWRHLWKKSSCANLTLDSGNRGEFGVFVGKVNRIVESLSRDDCNTMTIDHLSLTLKLIADDDKIYQSDIDRWLSFAFQKKVQRLNLDCCTTMGENCYSLTDSPQAFYCFGMLRSLSLDCVEVSGDLLEYILTVTPHLEELFVRSGGPSLVDFTVAGPSLKLKFLQILDPAFFIKRLYINNVNLELLNYYGHPESLIIEQTPCLRKVCTSIFTDFHRMKEFAQMLSKIPTLETLTLRAVSDDKSFHQFPKLRNLKRLELVLGYGACCRNLCASLLDASPVLCELKIKLYFGYLWSRDDSRKEEERVIALSNPHKSLKVIEINQFTGCETDMGIVDYLIENTVLIEKMIVDTRVCCELKDPKEHEVVRALARAHMEKRLTGGTAILVI